MSISTRRLRRPSSLATSVAEVVNEFQCPVLTTAMRVILMHRGRPTTAEQLGTLAAYEKADYLRTRLPPRLCSAIDAETNSVKPRWWARGEWRLQRRIMTEDVKPIWIATLAEQLCLVLADQPAPSDSPIASLALGSIRRTLGHSHFDVPLSAEDWMNLRREVYEQHMDTFRSRTDATPEQSAVEAKLIAAERPGIELLFGKDAV
jgi:hypothetical protein